VTGRSTERDRAVFEELYRDTRLDVLVYVTRRSKNPEDAADVLAETYRIAWQKLGTMPTGGQARAWLFGVARNELLKGATRRRKHAALTERLADELRLSRSSDWPTDDRADRVRTVLQTLSERDREILTLTAWEGLTPREIAVVVGTSANVVRVRLHRARSQLKLQLVSLTAQRTRFARETNAESHVGGSRTR
jgi:RNA polymerase sigma factor (sigma-70 family)